MIMYAAIRLRSGIKMRKEEKDTLKSLRLTRKNTLVLLPDTKASMGMLHKVDNFIAWGTASQETEKAASSGRARLKTPKGGLKSVKQKAPKGDIGYLGEKINDLAKRMGL